MGFGEIKKKVTDAVSKHSDKVDEGIDKAADFADEKTGGKYTDKIDTGTDKTKEYVDKLDDDENRS